MLQAFLTEFQRRWKLVLLVAIVASAALVGEKALTKAPVVQSTSLYVEQEVAIQYGGAVPGSSQYADFFTSYGNFLAFVRQTEKTFDYEKFQPGWNHMDGEAKAKWMKKHFLLQDANPSAFSVAFYVSGNEWKDAAYARENGRKLVQAYIDFAQGVLQGLGQQVTFQAGEPIEILPEETVIPRRSFLGKYAVIGFVLGGLAACVGLLVIAARKSHA